MASSMPEYLTMQNSGSMKSLTEFWVGYERLWISRTSPFFFLTRKIGDTLKVGIGGRVSPSDFDHLGFSFDNKFYFDKCLPFGASISCSLFEKFSTALHRFTEQKTGNKDILNYLDDFLFGAEADSPKCQFTL
jgi:hypothetical protein